MLSKKLRKVARSIGSAEDIFAPFIDSEKPKDFSAALMDMKNLVAEAARLHSRQHASTFLEGKEKRDWDKLKASLTEVEGLLNSMTYSSKRI